MKKLHLQVFQQAATYNVVEDAPKADDTWVQETTSDVTGKIEADVTSAAVVTNKTKTTVKVM